MKTIELHFNAFHIGNLSYKNEHYTFVLNEENSKLLLKAGINIAVFEAQTKKTVSKTLPLVFENFLPKEQEKQELLEKFGVLKTDNDFEKLIKISALSLNKNGFWLKTV